MSNQLLITIVLFLAPLLMGIIVLKGAKSIKKQINLLLAFSGAFILSICFVELLPAMYHNEMVNPWWVIVGFFLQLILDYLSRGVEHGHIHTHSHEHGKMPMLVLLGLCIHSLLEVIPIEESAHLGIEEHTYTLGILFHKLPVAAVLMSLFVARNLSKLYAILGLIIFSLSAPIGIWIGEQLSNANMAYLLTDVMLPLSVGIFLHLSTTILFESSQDHRPNFKKLLAFVLGVVLAYLSLQYAH